MKLKILHNTKNITNSIFIFHVPLLCTRYKTELISNSKFIYYRFSIILCKQINEIVQFPYNKNTTIFCLYIFISTSTLVMQLKIYFFCAILPYHEQNTIQAAGSHNTNFKMYYVNKEMKSCIPIHYETFYNKTCTLLISDAFIFNQ